MNGSTATVDSRRLTGLKERALAAAGDGITISDPRQPDNPLIYVNRGFERLTGYRAEELIGRGCLFLRGPETDADAVAALEEAMNEGRPASAILRNYRRDGSAFWNQISIDPVHGEGDTVSHFISVQTDVTARIEAEEKLRHVNRELAFANERMSRSLEAAAEIQRSLLPQNLPQIDGLRFAWTFEPCDELAGDSLNVFAIDDDKLGLYVLDVSGHGVPAALLSVTLARVLSFSLRPSDMPGSGSFADPSLVASPAAVAERLNVLFPMGKLDRQYFTLFYGVLDLPSRRLRYVTAGHPAPILQRSGEKSRHLPVGGFPIGMATEPNYEERQFQLESGDRLFVYTDGLIEASDSDDREFGAERLSEQIRLARDLPLSTAVETISATASRWADDSPEDDLSVLALEIES